LLPKFQLYERKFSAKTNNFTRHSNVNKSTGCHFTSVPTVSARCRMEHSELGNGQEDLNNVKTTVIEIRKNKIN